MPFKTEIRGKKYLALHNMINFLEDPDPTLRLSCRSWLSQNRQFNRILDPIIEEFIKYSNFKIVQNMTVIDGDFDTQYVIENFGKLRNIILNSQDDIIEYILVKTCQGHIINYYSQKYNKQHGYDPAAAKGGPPMEPSTSALQPPADATAMRTSNVAASPAAPQGATAASMGPGQIDSRSMPSNPMLMQQQLRYLDILIEVTLQYIRAEHSAEKKSQYASAANAIQNENQFAETLTVNASACEFMELLLKQFVKYSSDSMKIAHVIIKPLIETFYHVIENKNYAMQVNIINLLDLIMNECNFLGTVLDNQSDRNQQTDARQKCIAIFKDSKLIDAIILGLQCDVSFVRQKFIKFVEMYVPYLRKFTRENENFKQIFQIHIELLMDCHCKLLKRVDVSFFSMSKKGQNSNIRLFETSSHNTAIQQNPEKKTRRTTTIHAEADQRSSG